MSNMGTREVDVCADMAAFDALPRALRDALNVCGGEYAALDLAPSKGGHLNCVERAFKLLQRAERRHGFGDVPELLAVIEAYRRRPDLRARRHLGAENG